MIPEADYKKMIAALPILCVDIALQDDAGRYLLIKRANEPLKDQWWVIGGRVLKGETCEQAARRKLKEEVNVEGVELKMLGLYEDFFDRNSLGIDTMYHTVSVVYRAKVPDVKSIRLDAQSKDWTFATSLPERLVIKSTNI